MNLKDTNQITHRSSENFLRDDDTKVDYEKIRTIFDNACLEIARRYDLRYKDGKPRKARIIQGVAQTSCVRCIDRELRNNVSNRVDALYRECHQQARDILIEELYDRFQGLGLTVSILTEAITDYCKADVLILPNTHGVSLISDRKEVAVEIKTGYSLSLVQLYRYMLDKPDRNLVLWRIRNKQVLTLEGVSLKPLLIQFMKMFILRADRLLSTTETPCEHCHKYNNWSPTQQQLQEAFLDFARSVTETLPYVAEVVVDMLSRQ